MLVSHDAPDKLKAFADARDIGYTMLSDAKAEIIPAFGIANPQFPRSSPWYGVAIPIIFVASPDGIVRHRFSQENYRDRVEIDAILDILRRDTAG